LARKNHGGRLSITLRFIFEQGDLGAPERSPPLAVFIVTWLARDLHFGNEAQKKKFFARISRKDWWFMVISRVRVRLRPSPRSAQAVRDGWTDYMASTATKTWTTLAQQCRLGSSAWCAPIRAKAQAGLSFLLIEMKSNPVGHRASHHTTIACSHEVNDSFLDRRAMSLPELIGEEHKAGAMCSFCSVQRSAPAGQHWAVPRAI